MAFKAGAIPRIDAEGHLPDDLVAVLAEDLEGLVGGATDPADLAVLVTGPTNELKTALNATYAPIGTVGGIPAGLFAARPAAADADWYFATDVALGTLYRSDGTTWFAATPGVDHTHPGGSEMVMTIDPYTAGATGGSIGTDITYYTRTTGSATITAIGLQVQTSSGTLEVGVYANNGQTGRTARPVGIKGRSGVIACPAVGWADIPLLAPVTVNEGDWFSLTTNNTTATFRRAMASNGSAFWMQGFTGRQISAIAPDTAGTITWDSGGSYFMVGVA